MENHEQPLLLAAEGQIDQVLHTLDNKEHAGKSRKIRFVGSTLLKEDADKIWNALVNHKCVRSLELCICTITRQCLIDLCNTIPNSSLVSIQLVNVKIINETAILLAESILEYANRKKEDPMNLSKHLHIRKLDLTFNTISQEAMHAYATLIEKTDIEILCLGRNVLEDNGCVILAEGIKKANPLFNSLDLRFNSITAVGMTQIADVLPFSNIRHLVLGNNEVKHEGMLALCNALPYSKVESLGLAYSLLEDISIIALMNTLRMTRVVTLDLSGNPFKDPAGLAIANEMKRNIHFFSMCAVRTQITRITMDAVYDALESHRSIEKCKLCDDESELTGANLKIQRRLDMLHTTYAKIFTSVCSVKIHSGSSKSIFKRMSIDLIRLVFKMLV